jgi:hypothetical protein
MFFQNTLQMEMAEQFNKQQLLLANAEAANIQAYIHSLKGELLHVAHFMTRLDMRAKTDFAWIADEVFRDKGNIRTHISFLSKKGEILFSNNDADIEKSYVSNLIEKAKRSCLDDAFIEQDSQRINIAALICRSNSFEGAVLLSLSIQDVASEFLAPIKSGMRGYAWMMDGMGDLLYHPTQPGMVGKNLYKTDSSCFKCHKSFEVEKKIIEGKSESYGIYVAPSGEDKVLAFSTASVGDSRWIVAVSAPYSEITMSIKRSMKFYSWLIISIFITTSFVSAMLIVFHRKRVKAEELAKHQKEL